VIRVVASPCASAAGAGVAENRRGASADFSGYVSGHTGAVRLQVGVVAGTHQRRSRGVFSRIELVTGAAVPALDALPVRLQTDVTALRGDCL
jgi:hypothetical protein